MRFTYLKAPVLAFAISLGAGSMLLTLQTAQCQVTTAAIHGTVTDPSGAVVPGAKITALNTATGISTETTANQSGYYTFPSLQVGGPYRITIQAPGFMKFQSTGVMLTANADVQVSAALKVGNSLQTVRVNAEAVQVETTNTQLQQTVSASQLENLPMLGRDAASMEKLAPGAVESSDRFGGLSVNGSQTTNNSYLIEGIDNNDGPLQDEGLVINPDALAEENIVTSTINPEFARNSGSIVNQIIKSGSNSIHGSGFEYYRDNFLNLPGYFARPGERTPYHQHLFGGTLGVPIVRNKLFGFMAYQGYRRKVGTIHQTPVFQDGVVSSGIFTNETNVANGGANGAVGLAPDPIPFDIKKSDGTPCGPGTAYANWSDCFPAGSPVMISPNSFDPLALSLAKKYVPAGNAGTSTAPFYNFSTANTRNQDQGILRADYHFSASDSIYGVGIFESTPSTSTLPFLGSTLPGFGEVDTRHYKLFAAQETHTFSPDTLNVLRAGYYRFNYNDVVPANPVSPSSLGFNINPQTPLSGIPYIGITGLFSLGFSADGPQPRKDTNLTFSDNFTRVMGNHELKFGATVEQFRVSNPFNYLNNGYYSYSGSGTYSSGDPGIDFLLGIPDMYIQSSGAFIDAMAWENYVFAQDSWHATSDLTINYGLAWDVETPYANKQYNGLGITCFSVSSATSKVFTGSFPGLLWPGDPGCNTSGGPTTKYNHFGPRVGFAWSPSAGPSGLIGEKGSHQFSIRGGVGVYYNRDQEEAQLQNLGDPPNFLESFGAQDFGGSPGFADPFSDVAGGGSEANRFPFVRPKPGTTLDWSQFVEQDISAFNPKYSVPYVYNFNLNIQRQLPGNMVMQIGYVGSLGHRLPLIYEGDPITAAGHAACLASATCTRYRSYQHYLFPKNAAQPATMGGYPDYLSVGTISTYGSSNYNSFQASLLKSTSHGLYFTLAYTYSHGLDNSSGLESSGFNGLGYNWVPGFQHLSYGDSDYDARHRLAASYDYQVPLLASMNQNFAVKEALGNWHVAGMTVLQTGFPITITNLGTYNSMWCDRFSYYSCPDNVNTSSFNIKNFNPRSKLNAGGLHQYFDTSTFSQEPIGTFGNAKRNFFHGPGYNYTNMSVYKNFPFSRNEARNVYIAMDAANVFNHANFAPPDANFTDGSYFGTVSAVGGAGADYNGDPAPGRTVMLAAKITF